jgi:hypothetical protein
MFSWYEAAHKKIVRLHQQYNLAYAYRDLLAFVAAYRERSAGSKARKSSGSPCG